MITSSPQYWLARYKNAGFSFFHFSSTDKSSLKGMPWKRWQTEHPTDEIIGQWLDHRVQNYAIVCGAISNLIVIDVDTKNGADPKPFQNRGFYEIRTPSGGYHFYVQYDPVFKSTKQFKRKLGGILQGVDIQSDRTLVFAPPSTFKQGGYTLVHDASIIPIPEDLMTQMMADMEPEAEATEFTPFQPIKDPLNGRPGDIFNALATWECILEPAGWIKVGRPQQGTQYWKRPGKKESAISASTNYHGYDLFFVYSTSTNLNPKKGYTKFCLYATIYHNGDFKAAARALVIDNYQPKVAHHE